MARHVYEVRGLDKLEEDIAAFSWFLSPATDRNTRAIVATAQALCPVDTGELQASIIPYRNGPWVGGAQATAPHARIINARTGFLVDALEVNARLIEDNYATQAQANLDSQITPASVGVI